MQPRADRRVERCVGKRNPKRRAVAAVEKKKCIEAAFTQHRAEIERGFFEECLVGFTGRFKQNAGETHVHRVGGRRGPTVELDGVVTVDQPKQRVDCDADVPHFSVLGLHGNGGNRGRQRVTDLPMEQRRMSEALRV